jgi:predicted RNA-binding protein with PUA-like domain
MTYWLFKEEPAHYSFAELERDGQTTWDGVGNNLALQHLRKVRKGDQVLCYHTGKEKAVVGVMRVLRDPYPDPTEKDSRLVVVDVQPLRRLRRPVSLAELKADPLFASWELIRLPRLSVMPVPGELWERIAELSRQDRA